jgi:thiol-disulfide isomerase/thioredoxin
VIVEDGALIVLSIVTILLWRGFRPPRWSRTATAIIAVPALVFTAFGSRLPADSFVTGISPGTDLSDAAIEDLRTPQSEGTALMVLVDSGCSPCEKEVPLLNEISRARRDVNVFAVYAGTRQDAMAWRLRFLPSFPVAHASARAMRAYYRALPAAFLLRNGRVVRAYWGRIPTLQEVSALLPQT